MSVGFKVGDTIRRKDVMAPMTITGETKDYWLFEGSYEKNVFGKVRRIKTVTSIYKDDDRWELAT